ncbi:MAG: hypothetical protein J1E56_07715 [Ruminococcus sp.]|nr:hypothetical protein [Ruminococcus sp.]
MKRTLLIFTMVFAVIVNLMTFTIEAANEVKYDIQIEKLSDSEDAKEFNLYRDELLSYFNKLIIKEKLTSLKKSDLDFKNEDTIQGVKVYGDYTTYKINASYEDIMGSLKGSGYSWKILIKTEKTAVFAVISPCDKAADNKFCFGKDNKWSVDFCQVSKSQGKEGSSTIAAVSAYSLYDSAETNLNDLITANKNDEIKVVYTNIGQSENDSYDYINGGIVFVNGKAKYIYSRGFILHTDRVSEKIPDYIKTILETNYTSDMCLNTLHSEYGCTHIKGLYNYDQVMALIKTYETYA